MKINKQLFEDVLSGKLKGTFVLRAKNTKVTSDKLKRNGSFYSDTHPYRLFSATYNPNGKVSLYDYERLEDIIDFIPDTDKIEIDPEMYSYNEKDIQFIEHFINGSHMKENELTIEIPKGKIVDWDESKKQNKIVFKNEQLNYRDICIKLSDKNSGHFYIDGLGDIEHSYTNPGLINTAPSKHQLECILAKNKLATVAIYLNDGWNPNVTVNGHFNAWVLFMTPDKSYIGCVRIEDCCDNSNVLFKSKELAQQAIEILGEETVKLALEPLGI